jgi:hypothetical protein
VKEELLAEKASDPVSGDGEAGGSGASAGGSGRNSPIVEGSSKDTKDADNRTEAEKKFEETQRKRVCSPPRLS